MISTKISYCQCAELLKDDPASNTIMTEKTTVAKMVIVATTRSIRNDGGQGDYVVWCIVLRVGFLFRTSAVWFVLAPTRHLTSYAFRREAQDLKTPPPKTDQMTKPPNHPEF